MDVFGSPPRVRGKQPGEPDDDDAERITPARAGKTSGFDSPRAARRDHPRACGENLSSVLACWIMLGSPPRVRGKRDEQRHGERGCGITPARAGKTWPSRT